MGQLVCCSGTDSSKSDLLHLEFVIPFYPPFLVSHDIWTVMLVLFDPFKIICLV